MRHLWTAWLTKTNLLGYLTRHSPKLLIHASINCTAGEPASGPKADVLADHSKVRYRRQR